MPGFEGDGAGAACGGGVGPTITSVLIALGVVVMALLNAKSGKRQPTLPKVHLLRKRRLLPHLSAQPRVPPSLRPPRRLGHSLPLQNSAASHQNRRALLRAHLLAGLGIQRTRGNRQPAV